MIVDVVATEKHYLDHLMPVYTALEPNERGEILKTKSDIRDRRLARAGTTALVASYGDMRMARSFVSSDIVLMEHGCGLTYRGVWNPSYAGADDRAGVRLFLSPNEYALRRNKAAHPGVPHAIVGCPKLDAIHRAKRTPHKDPAVAVSFHWDCEIVPETRSALEHFLPALAGLRDSGLEVLGHGHPRIFNTMQRIWEEVGVEPVRDFDEILRRADCYAVDNSSTLYEFASTGMPVVVMNAPWYRRDVHHGLRFWEHADIGPNADEPEQLLPAIEEALEDHFIYQVRRDQATMDIYPVRRNAAETAVEAIREVMQ